VSPRALWLPYAVTDLDAAQRFYVDRLGLSIVDQWRGGDERGVVLRAAPGAFIELVTPGAPGQVPIAFEVDDADAVDWSFQRWRPTGDAVPPHRYPRGHYGFEAAGPAGARVMVWSEKR
jgi:catechol 2,3-dioxygenase-like lactoylglutathione lyase family enzyme